MIPIFEYKDIFDGDNFTTSNNPLINELQETIQEGLIKGEITGYTFDKYGGEDEFIVKKINEYNKFYIFTFLADKYPNYGFLDSGGNFSFKGDFFSFGMESPVIDIKHKEVII